MQKSPLFQLQQAGVKRGGQWLVRGVDLSVMRGEIVTLIGPNGSGKSTTAKLALGILEPSEGKSSRRSGLRVGYVPQKLLIDWTLPLSVARFMSLTARLSAGEIDAALEKTGVQHLLHAEVRHLSGGEMQRVQLARAIARKPDLLVLDEPVQGVDYAGEIAIYDLISGLGEDIGCGILMISHDLHVVMAATDQVVCLNGHVCCRGTPKAVSQSPVFQKLFGHRGDAALAVYEHNHDHVHLPDGRVRHADGSVSDDCAGEHCSAKHGAEEPHQHLDTVITQNDADRERADA
ncbi:metal ABC transporter ATP-binding protein [Roseibium algae]|uniref:Metal ABC transporter ATP-binding protein n=1 Tax=Roseibium algae TaxID=3123038 RepID=A0ABU8TN21_9HYPH